MAQFVKNFLFAIILFIEFVVIVMEEKKKIIECPKEYELRKLDKKERSEREFELLYEMQETFKEMLSENSEGFAHRIVRDETLKENSEWQKFHLSVASEIFGIGEESEFEENNFAILTEEEYVEHAKKCEESEEYSRKIGDYMLSSTLNNSFYRMCLHKLIANSEEFQHFLCYHKNIEKYKKALYLTIGHNEFFLLEELNPIIMHIEIMPKALRMDTHKTQFQFRTNSENANAELRRIIFRKLLADPKLAEDEQDIGQSAQNGSEIGQHIINKAKVVKMEAMESDRIGSPGGICMVSKLATFLREPNKVLSPKKGVSIVKSIDKWWPSECEQREEAQSVVETQRIYMRKGNRELYSDFMIVWLQLATLRGGPTRLHKFLCINEPEIEFEIANNERYTDPGVFRSADLLQKHYLDAFTTISPEPRQALKLATDIFCWVLWLENDVLKLWDDKKKEKGKVMPRFTMAWKQNRWYYEMVYDQMFDIEEANGKAEVPKKKRQIGTLLQMSKHLVEQKLKMPDEKLRVELRNKKLERLKKGRQYGTASPPPNGTVDREWHEIRRKSEEGKEDEKQSSAIEEWLKQRHFDTIKGFLCNSEKFNREFEQRASDNVMRIDTFVGGVENVREIYDMAEKCKEKFANPEENAKNQNENFNEKSKENYSDEKETKNMKKLGKDEEKADQTKVFDMDEALKYVNSEKENNEGKSKKKKKGKKKPKRNKMPSEIGTKSEEEKQNEDKKPMNGKEENKLKKAEMTADKIPSESNLSEKDGQFVEKESYEELMPKKDKNDGTNFEIITRKENEKDNGSEGETMREKEKEKKEKIIKKKKETKNSKNRKEKHKQQNKNTKMDQDNNNNSTEKGEEMGEKIGISDDDGTLLGVSMAIRKEFEVIGLLDDEKGFLSFLEDEFLIKIFKQFFTISSDLMRQIVAIGCHVNEIGHRMEIIGKLYPTDDQKLLNAFKELEIAPSKWINKKLEQNWQLIRNELATKISQIKGDRIAVNSPDEKIDQIEISSRLNCDLDIFCLKTLQKMLWKQTKIILKFVDANAIDEKGIENEEKEMDFIEKQIQMRKMALALLTDKNHFELAERKNEFQIGSNAKEKFQQTLIEFIWEKSHKKNAEKGKKSEEKPLVGTEFGPFFNRFSLMVEQIEQDRKLLIELSKYLRQEFEFAQIFGISLHLQEIKHFDGQNGQLMANDSEALASLDLFISKNGFGLIENEQKLKIEDAISEIEQIIRKWNSMAKFTVTGSYQLGALTKKSDIDAICVVPEMPSWEAAQFFGSAKCEVQSNGDRKCADNSLFCHLCLVAQVAKLNRTPDAWMPLIEFKFEISPNTFVDFDIGLTTFALQEEIFKTEERINYEQSDALSAKMANEIGQLANRRREFITRGGGYKELIEMINEEEKLRIKLRSLAAFEVGIIILNKLFATEKREKEDNQIVLRNYRTLLLAVKMWAKEHHIYDNKLGFFNGISLSLLVAKVMLLYPMASLPFLIEKFFFTFSTWPWPTPVKLSDLPDGSALRWDPHEEMRKRSEIGYVIVRELAMPIVTPGRIEQNATFNVNRSTATIIRREMQNAFKIVRNWPNLGICLNEKWKSLIKAKQFNEKFSHFIRIICKAFALADFYDFCGYVETRIRLQLLVNVVPFDRVRLAHAKKVAEKEQDGERNNKKTAFFKIWLVGIELDEEIASENESERTTKWNNWKKALNSMLSDQFNADILKAYRIKNGFGGPLPHFKLTAQYEEK
ncbi:hypothetical protein niasHT_009784 [Heterodera trifolii]|uniref:polynucleotide adenylyltransferase n=1 Tax=Heterodera trifolii TaxID=157864 RepID=A0ABD2MFA8_9BILA